MPFSDFYGNTETVNRLRDMLARERFPHAVVLSGAAGAGKYTLALMLARALNCLNPTTTDGLPDFCGVCANCTRIALSADLGTRFDEAVEARLQKFFPAAKRYEIVHRNLYVTHQRVAARFRAGRVLLAGDAAHVNNPIGGMGLNGGLQDAANAAEKLAAVMLEGADERLLDLYNLQRRTVATEFVQEQSIANKNRLEARDPEARRRNLDDLKRMADDPARARQFLLRSSLIAAQRRVAAMTLADLPA